MRKERSSDAYVVTPPPSFLTKSHYRYLFLSGLAGNGDGKIVYNFRMPSDLQYRSRAVRVLVLLHEDHLRRFLQIWRQALAASVVLPPTEDPAYASLSALGRHVLGAAGSYMVWMCKMLTLPDPGIRAAPVVDAIVRDADDYMEHVLDRWLVALKDVPDERLETPEYPSEWRTRYSIDAMLENAVMHPIRHPFQLDELMKSNSRASKEALANVDLRESNAG